MMDKGQEPSNSEYLVLFAFTSGLTSLLVSRRVCFSLCFLYFCSTNYHQQHVREASVSDTVSVPSSFLGPFLWPNLKQTWKATAIFMSLFQTILIRKSTRDEWDYDYVKETFFLFCHVLELISKLRFGHIFYLGKYPTFSWQYRLYMLHFTAKKIQQE
jgi:hypothetical protein